MTAMFKEGAARACRVCGCTEVTACVDQSGPCAWVGPDLCSACPDVPVRWEYEPQGDWWTAYLGAVKVARLFCRFAQPRQKRFDGRWWLPSETGGPTLADMDVQGPERDARRRVSQRIADWLKLAGLGGAA